MFQDRDEELKRLEQALLEEEEEEAEAEEETYDGESECEEEYEEAESEEPETLPSQDPRRLVATVLLVTAGVLLFLAYLLARREGLI